MLKITSVEPQKKNPHRLITGKILDSSDVEKLLLDSEVGKLMERMYRLFNIRQRSEKELRDYLRNLSFKRKVKGQEEISPFIIDAIVQLMKRKNMLDDMEFAKSWVESRRRKKGPRVLKQELFQKGIDREIIEEVMSDKGEVVSQEETASQLLEKKMRIWKTLPKMELRKKAYDFLLRRGFEYEIVKDIIEKIMKKEYDGIRESGKE